MKDKMYLVMAYQYGCRQGHIYPVGVYKSFDAAKHNLKKEFKNRAGKYSVTLFETRHPNKTKPERLKLLLHLESPYKDRLKSFSQT